MQGQTESRTCTSDNNHQGSNNNSKHKQHPFLKITQLQNLQNSSKPDSLITKTVFDSKFVLKYTDQKQIRQYKNEKFCFNQQIKGLFTSLLERAPIQNCKSKTPNTTSTSRSRKNNLSLSFDIRVQSKSFSLSQRGERSLISKSKSKQFQQSVQRIQEKIDKSVRIKSIHKICPQSILQPCKINSMSLSERKNTADKYKNNFHFRNRRRNISQSMVGKQIQNLERQQNWKPRNNSDNNIGDSFLWQKDITLTPWMKQDESKLEFF